MTLLSQADKRDKALGKTQESPSASRVFGRVDFGGASHFRGVQLKGGWRDPYGAGHGAGLPGELSWFAHTY